jgi:cyclopropane-fatty-acyl-phospholipid synthase
MVFSKNRIDYEDIDINALYGSDAHVLALLVKKFPGSWLPYGSEMLIKNAELCFKLLYKSSGRLDYIETIRQWRKKLRKFNLQKYWLYLNLLPKILLDKNLRHQLADFRISPNKVCFEREIMDHYRMVFEKVK